jgi:hypothetical protein
LALASCAPYFGNAFAPRLYLTFEAIAMREKWNRKLLILQRVKEGEK